MSANDILDVLNIQRDDALQSAKKRQKVDQPTLQKNGMARELYNLMGPNTPPVSINFGGKKDRRQKVSPWTRMPFVPNKKLGTSATFHHWEKGSKELLETSGSGREYFFDKFLVAINIPDMVDEVTFDSIMAEIKEQEHEREQAKQKLKNDNSGKDSKDLPVKEKRNEAKGAEKSALARNGDSLTEKPTILTGSGDELKTENGKETEKVELTQNPEKKSENEGAELAVAEDIHHSSEKAQKDSVSGKSKSDNLSESMGATGTDLEGDKAVETKENPAKFTLSDSSLLPSFSTDQSVNSTNNATTNSAANEATIGTNSEAGGIQEEMEWTYSETALLFDFCKNFELKWHIINDRFPAHYNRSMEDLKEQFYRICAKVLKYKGTGNPNLLESLDAYSKLAEIDRKKYLESFLKRSPAEIAEEESLVIEARRFELAAKKMLMERSNLLTLLDSPQASQSVQQYLSSQGLTNLYNNLMILDKHQKKKIQQKAAAVPADPVPPPIPLAASLSHKRDRTFQTHLQQYLAGVLKLQGPQPKGSEPNAIQQLLAKRLTAIEEEAYGLMYHANERLTPNVILRSTQKLPGLQQRQSVFKAVNNVLHELEIPTAGGTTWKPNMPTRKTMAKYDEMVRSVVALLDVKKGRDKLEAEIDLIKSQRNLQ